VAERSGFAVVGHERYVNTPSGRPSTTAKRQTIRQRHLIDVCQAAYSRPTAKETRGTHALTASIAPSLFLATPFLARALSASAQEEALAYYNQAKINWRQADGQSLTIGLNKHPFTESLLPLIPGVSESSRASMSST